MEKGIDKIVLNKNIRKENNNVKQNSNTRREWSKKNNFPNIHLFVRGLN
jgi:hypothetical protein